MDGLESGDVLGLGTGDATVRPARPGDVAEIAAVQVRAWRTAYADVLDPEALAGLSPGVLEPAWRTSVAGGPAGSAVLVACAGTSVVGVAAVRPAADGDAEPGEGELATLVVDPAHQRAGHGSRLLSAAAAALQDAGVTTVLVWCPALDEARRTFFASAGLEPDGARRVYETSDGRRVTEVRLRAALT